MFKYPITLQISIAIASGLSISGTVSDSSNGSSLIGANVILKGTSLGAATNSDGRYIINQIPLGDYILSVSIWDLNHMKKISIKNPEDLSINILLIPEAIKMETYVVTASRRRERVEDALQQSVISKKLRLEGEQYDLGDYLKGTKGIDFTQSGIDSYNMTARGFNSSFSSRLLTLTDGRMANVPSLRLTAYNHTCFI